MDEFFNKKAYKVRAELIGVGKKGLGGQSSLPVTIVNEIDTSNNITVEQLSTLTPTWIDSPDNNTTYIGYSTDGNKSNPTTAIYKIVKDGTLTEFYVVESGTAFNQIWNNRTTLTYKYKTV